MKLKLPHFDTTINLLRNKILNVPERCRKEVRVTNIHEVELNEYNDLSIFPGIVNPRYQEAAV